MAVAERLRDALPSTGGSVPKSVEKRVERAKKSMTGQRSKVNESYEFWRGNQYVFVNQQNYLVQQGTVTNPDGTGKPRHRVRQTRNLIHPIVEAKLSATTTRVPGYEVAPSSNDPGDIAAANVAEKLALFGYTKWGLRKVSVKAVTGALVAGEAFAMPYFDASVGPFEPDGDGGYVGQGEVKVKVFGKNEVAWEDGVDFEDSPWFVIVQGQTPERIKALPGYIGPPKLQEDAKTSEILGSKKQGEKLVMVFEYIERPSAENRDGLRLTIANGRVVTTPEPYPCRDAKGRVADMPILHKLSYTVDSEEGRDRGLVDHLIDAQRTYNDANNKTIEHKNLCLFPQSYGLPNILQSKKTDEPGAHYIVADMNAIKWIDPPNIPPDLWRMKEEAKADMWAIAWASEIPTQVESGKGIEQIIAQLNEAWQHFIAGYAEWHAGVMRSCLYTAQTYYTEERLIKIRGDVGWEPTPDFQGASLQDQIDVRVDPSTVIKRSKEQIRQEIMNIVQTFPGWLSPEEAVRALQTGRAEAIIQGYENDLGRANRVIQKIKEGPEDLFAVPPRPVMPGEMVPPDVNPETGEQVPVSEVPGWMPRPFDNIAVHKKVFEDWMKTLDYENSDPQIQEAANLYYGALLNLEAQKAQRDAEQQQMAAEQAGLNNASGPAAQGSNGAKPMPSLPSLGENKS